MNRPWNFAAGPSTLPLEVLQQAAAEMCDWGGSGTSVMEMSHRGKHSSRCGAVSRRTGHRGQHTRFEPIP